MYLIVEENNNCSADERVFPTFGMQCAVSAVETDRLTDQRTWCDVVGVDENGAFVPAQAQQMEDSSDGVAWLVFGGAWGLRLRPTGGTPWSLTDPSQRGVPFLVLDQSGKTIRFQS